MASRAGICASVAATPPLISGVDLENLNATNKAPVHFRTKRWISDGPTTSIFQARGEDQKNDAFNPFPTALNSPDCSVSSMAVITVPYYSETRASKKFVVNHVSKCG